MTSLETRLDDFLKMDPGELIKDQERKFGKLISNTGDRYVLFGAGALGCQAYSRCREASIPVLGFADNNPALWGTSVNGLPVYSPASAAQQFGSTAVFIVTVFNNGQVMEQLCKMGLKVASFAALAWHYPQTFLPYFDVDHPEKIFTQADSVRTTLGLWSDEKSRQEYAGQIGWHLTLDPSTLAPHLPQEDIYFPDDLATSLAKEVFVDCGAFDGDTIQHFVDRRAGTFSQIIAIEPDPANIAKLEARLGAFDINLRRRIRIIKSAVGSKASNVTFNATGSVAAAIGAGDLNVQCAPLDDLLEDDAPTFIKMDIEGAEPDALQGSQKIILKDEPILAVCLYHAQEHLWQIPSLIHSLHPGYDLFLRRYADECWETVCYAVPKARSLL